LFGVASAASAVLPLRRLIYLARHGRFSASLFPADQRVLRGIELLRVADALADRASLQEIIKVLFENRSSTASEARDAESLRSRARRLIVDARSLAAGGYRWLWKQRG